MKSYLRNLGSTDVSSIEIKPRVVTTHNYNLWIKKFQYFESRELALRVTWPLNTDMYHTKKIFILWRRPA